MRRDPRFQKIINTPEPKTIYQGRGHVNFEIKHRHPKGVSGNSLSLCGLLVARWDEQMYERWQVVGLGGLLFKVRFGWQPKSGRRGDRSPEYCWKSANSTVSS